MFVHKLKLSHIPHTWQLLLSLFLAHVFSFKLMIWVTCFPSLTSKLPPSSQNYCEAYNDPLSSVFRVRVVLKRINISTFQLVGSYIQFGNPADPGLINNLPKAALVLHNARYTSGQLLQIKLFFFLIWQQKLFLDQSFLWHVMNASHYPSSLTELTSQKQRGVCCLKPQRMIEEGLGCSCYCSLSSPWQIPVLHLHHSFLLMCWVWTEDESVISICSSESLIVIKSIVFSLFQPGTMIEWGNYW